MPTPFSIWASHCRWRWAWWWTAAAGRCWRRASALPLLIFLAVNFQDNNFFFTRDFAAKSARDIAFLKSRDGPALCDQLSLCLWAGKDAQVDVFNIGEAIKTGARDPAPLVGMIDDAPLRHPAA